MTSSDPFPAPSEPADESDEMLMALADGELDDAAAERLWARIERDPALADRLAQFIDSRDALRGAWPPEPVPDPLVAAIMAAPDPRAGAARPILSSGVSGTASGAAPRTASGPSSGTGQVVPLRRRPSARQITGWALAASVMLAVGLGGFLAGRGAPGMPGGAPLAQAAALLEEVPTGGRDGLPGGTVGRVLASYQTDLGLCRLIEAGVQRGLVCRDTAGWSVAVAVPSTAGDAYLPASDLGTGLLDAALDEIGAGPALDPDAEAEALALAPAP